MQGPCSHVIPVQQVAAWLPAGAPQANATNDMNLSTININIYVATTNIIITNTVNVNTIR